MEYRKALNTFQRLDRGERAALAKHGLAHVLWRGESPTEKELDEAEQLLLEAADFFRRDPVGWMDELETVLMELETFYTAWGVVDAARDVAVELDRVRNPPPPMPPAR
jgi:hypothetical protein